WVLGARGPSEATWSGSNQGRRVATQVSPSGGPLGRRLSTWCTGPGGDDLVRVSPGGNGVVAQVPQERRVARDTAGYLGYGVTVESATLGAWSSPVDTAVQHWDPGGSTTLSLRLCSEKNSLLSL